MHEFVFASTRITSLKHFVASIIVVIACNHWVDRFNGFVDTRFFVNWMTLQMFHLFEDYKNSTFSVPFFGPRSRWLWNRSCLISMKIRHPNWIPSPSESGKKSRIIQIFGSLRRCREWSHSRETISCYFNNFQSIHFYSGLKRNVGTRSARCVDRHVYRSKIELKSQLIMRAKNHFVLCGCAGAQWRWQNSIDFRHVSRNVFFSRFLLFNCHFNLC